MGIGGHAAKYQLVDKNTRISNSDTYASSHTTMTWKRKHNGNKKKKSKKMFYARNKRKKRQKCRHDQWPLQGRALPREETTKYEPTSKTNISGRKLHHENNMHYRMWKLTHLTKKNIIFGQKTWFLYEYRNFGQKREQPLDRKNTTAVWDGLMWGGKKRHTAKEFRKSTLGNESCSIFKKWCENTPSPLSEIFFHKNFKRGKCQIK